MNSRSDGKSGVERSRVNSIPLDKRTFDETRHGRVRQTMHPANTEVKLRVQAITSKSRTFPTLFTGSSGLERNASIDRSLRKLLIFSAMLLKRRNLCRFLNSRGWAKSTGEELTHRNMLSENGPHGIDGRSRRRPSRGGHGHLHLLHRRTSPVSSAGRATFQRSESGPQGVGYIGANLARSLGRSLPFWRPSTGRAI